MYSFFIKSHTLYGILNWGCANSATLEPLKRNLRRAIRIIDFAEYTAHSDLVFKRLEILNFDKLNMLETAKFMFQISKGNNTILYREIYKNKQSTSIQYKTVL